jgi:predicted membrane protein
MFHKAFKHLKSKIQFLADNQKLNDKQLAEYNEILTGLRAGYEEERRMNEYLLHQLNKVSSDYNRLDANYKDHVTCLEAICLAHGIIDINMHLSRGRFMLEQEVIMLREMGGFIMPAAFRDETLVNNFKNQNNWKPKYDLTN